MLVMMGAPRGLRASCGSATRPRAHMRNVEAGTSTIRAASDIVYSGSLNLDGSRAVDKHLPPSCLFKHQGGTFPGKARREVDCQMPAVTTLATSAKTPAKLEG